MTESERKKLEQARKAGLNGLICRGFRFAGEQIAKMLASTPVTPNQLSVLAFCFICVGCLFGLLGNQTGWILFSVFLITGTKLDFSDGSLARLRNQTSRLGFYLDNTLDDLGNALIAFSIFGGLWNSGERGLVLAAPAVVYAGDIAIAHIMTRYRSEFLDPITLDQDPEQMFSNSPLLNLGRNLIPPFYPRIILFLLAGIFNLFTAYLIFDALYNTVLAVAFGVKVGTDIHAGESSKK